MAKTYAIDAVFRIIDGATAPMRAIDAKSSAVARSFAAAEKRVSAAGRAMHTFGKLAAGAAVGAIGAGIAVATKQYIEFNDALTKSGALFKDTQNLSGDEMEAALDAIGAKAREVAAVTEYSATDTAGALQKMAMAGIDSKTALDMLKGTTDLATAAGMDLTSAVDIATDALSLLSKDKSIAAMAGNVEGQLNRISDAMAYTQASFNTDMGQMWEAMKNSAAGFMRNGQSIDVLSAAIGSLANAGVKGGEAGTQLNALMTTLSQGSKQAKLREAGIEIMDSAGNYLNLFDIIAQLEQKTSSMADVEKSAFLSSIFDVRAMKAVNQLMNEGSDALKQYEANIMASGGAAAQAAATMRMSIGNQIKVLQSALTEKGFQFVEKFKGLGSESLTKLTDFVSNLNIDSIANAALGAVEAFSSLIQTVWKLRDPIIGVTVAVGTYKALMMGVVIAQKAWAVIQGVRNALMVTDAATMGAAAVAQGAYAGATTTATAAQTAFNVAATANPIGIIITAIIAAIAALVGIIVICVKHWDDITAAVGRFINFMGEFFSSVWDAVTAKFKEFGEWISTVFIALWGKITEVVSLAWDKFSNFVTGLPIIGDILGFVSERFNALTQAFAENGIVGALKSIGGTIVSFILKPVEAVLNTVSKIPGIGKYVKPAADAVANLRDSTVDWGKTPTEAAVNAANPNVIPWPEEQQSNARDFAPVTQGERYAYSRDETLNESRMTIELDKGLKGTVSGKAPDIDVQQLAG